MNKSQKPPLIPSGYFEDMARAAKAAGEYGAMVKILPDGSIVDRRVWERLTLDWNCPVNAPFDDEPK